MSFSQQQFDDLSAAIAEGVTTVSSNGRQVTYRSLKDMMQLRDLMAQELGLSAAGRKRKYFSFQRD